MLRRFLFLFFLLCAACTQVSAETIRVGSWNIEQLEFPGARFGDAAGIAQKPEDLAAHIKASGVDVLALQEIGDTLDPGRRSPTMDATFAILNADGGNWTYEITANKTPEDTSQLTGVAWNRNEVSKVGSAFRFSLNPPSNSFNHWDRHPSAFKFSAGEGESDFVVVSLHMKAGTSNSNKQQRAQEAQALSSALAGFRSMFQEEDIILIGDTNARSVSETALAAITSAGFVDLNADGQTTVPWGEAPFDHIFLASGQPEGVGAAMTRMVTNNDDERRKLSDHFLVHTNITIHADDDANVPFGNDGVPGGPIGPPPPVPQPTISILAVLPNPVGPDGDSESVTIANGGASDVSLEGWKLVDRANNTFNLSGTVPASGTVSITLDESLPLNQSGDDVKLINATGEVVHEVSYTSFQVVEGKFITF